VSAPPLTVSTALPWERSRSTKPSVASPIPAPRWPTSRPLTRTGGTNHPAILSKGGLGPALKTLARRSAVPVDLDLDLGVDRRLPDSVEVGAYYVVSEALTNAAKHARASVVKVGVEGQTIDILAVAGLAWLAVRVHPVARAEFESDDRRRAEQAIALIRRDDYW
jgi:hypothetical protein